MNLDSLLELAAEWRAEAVVLRRRAATVQAELLEGVAQDLEHRLGEWTTQPLTVNEAAAESGYSEDHLRDLVRSGRLPDNRPPGSEGRIQIRRCDLPRKIPETTSVDDIVGDMALELVQ